MPERTEEDYCLASRGMGGAWSQELGRIATGASFHEDCSGCGEFLWGIEYEPRLTQSLVLSQFVVWHGRR
jgi:hypothetical protein